MLPTVQFAPLTAEPRPTQPFELPCQLGDWRLESIGGEGSLARVFRGRRMEDGLATGDEVAVKVLRQRWEDRSQAVGLLFREVEVARSVRHRHLISVLDADLSEPPYHLVMPWIDGPSLELSLANHDYPRLPVALWITRQVAEALGALHAKGWVHGDVKPGNILVADEQATLIDLGFCRHIEENIVNPGQVAGTVAYMAPETLSSPQRPDPRSDLYSLGVTLFELLAGRRPFVADDLPGLARAHRETAPPNLRALAPSLPREAAELVACLLAKDPAARPQSAEELVRRLVRLEVATFAERCCA